MINDSVDSNSRQLTTATCTSPGSLSTEKCEDKMAPLQLRGSAQSTR